MLKALRQWLKEILTPTSENMSKQKSTQVHVHATKEGPLYVKPGELFTAPKVQSVINKMLNSEILKEATKTSPSS